MTKLQLIDEVKRLKLKCNDTKDKYDKLLIECKELRQNSIHEENKRFKLDANNTGLKNQLKEINLVVTTQSKIMFPVKEDKCIIVHNQPQYTQVREDNEVTRLLNIIFEMSLEIKTDKRGY